MRNRRPTISEAHISETRDRIGAAFRALRREGILARQGFLCCQSCAGYAMGERADKLAAEGKAPRGWVFYHGQDRDSLRTTGEVYIAFTGYGETTTEEIGVDAAHQLREFGLEVEWDGTDRTRILVKGPAPQPEFAPAPIGLEDGRHERRFPA